MALNIDLSGLWSAVKKMGDYSPDFSLDRVQVSGVDIDGELSGRSGLDIALEDLETDKGVLSYAGRQVLLFIPDHSFKIDDVCSGAAGGNRFHVADCQTLDSMRQRKRFDRYKATYNTSGIFEIFGTSKTNGNNYKAEVELYVCKNCLGFLNYQGYKSGGSRALIFDEFDIAEFLSAYSTLFRYMPDRSDMVDEAGYSDDWDAVSASYRASVNYGCESCRIDLSRHKRLLHTHHINGNKRQNNISNLKALCLDCHRKQPHHDYMRVSHENMQIIIGLRRTQGLLNGLSDWPSVRDMADKALDGLLRHYEKKGVKCPEVGYELQGSDHAVVAELEIAWPAVKRGIAINNDSLVAAQKLGWKVLSVGEAMRQENK